MTKNDIKKKLGNAHTIYSDIRIGLAGSYANGTQTKNSDIDIVIDGDSSRLDIEQYIRRQFSNNKIDIIWIDLMKADDEEADVFALKNGLDVNKYSAYKTIMKEVEWI